MSASVLEAARRELRLGHVPIAVPRGSKRPVTPRWQESQPDEAGLARLFGNGCNLGILLGAPSGGLVDVDLDWPEARGVATALLLRTESVFGRRSAPASHWRYYADPLLPTTKFLDPTERDDRAMIVEFRSTGAQTIHPPSLHPDGETYAWQSDGPPTRVEGGVLLGAVERVAAAALLARHWPGRGARHEAALALAGALGRAEWATEDAEEFVRAVARTAGDEEVDDRVTAVRYTEKRLAAADARSTGYTRLAELVGAPVAERVKEWLGLPEERWPLLLDGRVLSGGEAEAPPEVAEETAALPGPPTTRPWPEPMGPAAFRGLAGDTVRILERFTEADQHGLLVSALTAFGCILNSGPFLMHGSTAHWPRLFALIVGGTGDGRKGESWNPLRRLLIAIDKDVRLRIQSGLSSGEGLIYAVRDPGYTLVKGELVMTDQGVSDKRLMVFEAEFARVLTVLNRDTNTLGAIMRDAWDTGDLSVMTKSPTTATGAHICVVGHVTPDELIANCDATWITNGFLNRFLVAMVRRARLLPIPEPLEGPELADLARRWAASLATARKIGRMSWTPAGRAWWTARYPELLTSETGKLGAMKVRAAPIVLRLAMTYALMDGEGALAPPALEAGETVWRYSERSVEYLFGQSTGNGTADIVLRYLRQQTQMTKTAIHQVFNRNKEVHEIDTALSVLELAGLAYRKYSQPRTGGRVETWFLQE
jgi:hypothetical protein